MVKPKSIQVDAMPGVVARQTSDNVDALWNGIDKLNTIVDDMASQIETLNKNLAVISRSLSE